MLTSTAFGVGCLQEFGLVGSLWCSMFSVGNGPYVVARGRPRSPGGQTGSEKIIPVRTTIIGVTSASPSAGSDTDLVAAVRAGNVPAFAELYCHHADSVRRVAARHVRGADAVADVVQETFTQALHHLDQLRDATRFRPWLLAIARNAATSQLRAGMRVTALDDQYIDAMAAPGPEPDQMVELRELAAQVQGCVAGLSQRDATAIAMVTHLGFSPGEVGAALNLSPGAAKVVVHRARRRLRDALVLQLMVGQPALACAEFQKILADDPSGAGKHVEHCKLCIDAAGAEVVPFSLSEPLDTDATLS